VPEFLATMGYRPFVYLPREDRFEPDAGDSQNVFYLPEAAQARVRDISSSSPPGSQRTGSPVR
jgi:hypothetical protein